LSFGKDSRDLTFFLFPNVNNLVHLASNSFLMNRSVFVLGFVGAILFSCSTETAEVSNETKTENVAQVIPNKILSVEIEGMVCKMGCGGSIRKGLNETGSVSAVEFDFVDDREKNTAEIAFDSNSISSEEIVQAISKLNDGQFTVKSLGESEIHDVMIDTEDFESGSSETVIESSTSSNRLPNLLDILGGFFIQ
jgi:copper chaperone CopZ